VTRRTYASINYQRVRPVCPLVRSSKTKLCQFSSVRLRRSVRALILCLHDEAGLISARQTLIKHSSSTHRRSIVVRTSVLAGELSLSCARLMDGCLTTLWVKRPLSVNEQGQLSLLSL